MSTIHPNLPQLAQSLLDLSGQTQPANSGSVSDASIPSAAPSGDTLTLSAASQPSDLSAAEAQIAQQNQLAALANPDEALAANQSAIAFLTSQPDTALAAQGDQNPATALNVIQGA